MNDFDPVDLSALAPDPKAWQSIMAQTMEQVDSALKAMAESGDDPIRVIASWRRSVLAAAAVVLVALLPAEVFLELRERRAETIHRLAALSAASVHRGWSPTGVEILRTIAAERWQ